MKNQCTKTRVRKTETEVATNCESTPIRPKSPMPQADKTNRKAQLIQLAGDQREHVPTTNSRKVTKPVKGDTK